MILVDLNLLLYASVGSFGQEHEAAHRWLDGRLNGPNRVGIPWESLLGFVRLITNPRIFEPAETMASAWGHVQDWIDRDNVWIPQPTPRHAEVLGALLGTHGICAKLVPDAHLAALAIEHGLTLCTTDGDFARFPNLRWENPLVS